MQLFSSKVDGRSVDIWIPSISTALKVLDPGWDWLTPIFQEKNPDPTLNDKPDQGPNKNLIKIRYLLIE